MDHLREYEMMRIIFCDCLVERRTVTHGVHAAPVLPRSSPSSVSLPRRKYRALCLFPVQTFYLTNLLVYTSLETTSSLLPVPARDRPSSIEPIEPIPPSLSQLLWVINADRSPFANCREPRTLHSRSRSMHVFFEQFPAKTADTFDAGQVTIDILSDDALLYVFDFHVAQPSKVEAWHTLVHVCRRWRSLVFGSPRRLNLRIECTGKTPVRDIWPALALPIVISGDCHNRTRLDNIMAMLNKHHDRVCRIELTSTWDWEAIFAVLEEPFPVLTVLKLYSSRYSIFPNPDQFLGGLTHLRSLSLVGISIPELLPKLLLSSTHLVDLRLKKIPISVLFFPEMVATLSSLTRLQVLHLRPEFDQESHSNWETRRLPLPTRTVLPSLIELKFTGAIEYLDDFMARIDAPLLNRLIVVAFCSNRVIVLNSPQILRFIGHVPKFQALSEAHIRIDTKSFEIWINSPSTRIFSDVLKLNIVCIEPELQLAQFCRSPFSPLLTLENLYIDERSFSRSLRGRTGNARWLELLRPFTSVKNLYLSENFTLRIASALEELGGGIVTEVLPALESFFRRAPAFGTGPGVHWETRCRTSAFRSLYSRFSVGQKSETRRVVGDQ